MIIRNYNDLSVEELKEVLKELEFEKVKSYGNIGRATIKTRTDGTKSHGDYMSKRIRKEVARVKTILREREIEGGKE